ncbi:MAG: hydroxymethylbilane synthase [Rhodospirillales bacterium 20-60-12]|nr:MAG: hydroxymethylbilane synthase [Rhodospirillales bacterium 20-60-12]HQT68283.1 hydroxymethylbilane synthase [Acetobacteraceae bacterium]HQU00816.1 hydroxymethylbilane synthase [Acetobacteraceae bacterium]
MSLAHPPIQSAGRNLPMRVGTRASPLARAQTAKFIERLREVCPALGFEAAFEEHVISTTGDEVQDRRLADIGGKGLFAKEIHEALIAGRIDFAVHSLKDLETTLPEGIVLACTLTREDARDALILGPGMSPADASDDPLNIWTALPARAIIGTSSMRRQAQLLHARPDLSVTMLRGNVQTRLKRIAAGDVTGSLLALAGLRRLGLAHHAAAVIDPEAMVPAAGQGIVGVTVRAADEAFHRLLAAIEDPEAKAVSTAERALLAALDGSCRTPIGGYARLLPDGQLHLTGLVARGDGSFLLKRSLHGAVEDAFRLGTSLGDALRADSPADIFAA